MTDYIEEFKEYINFIKKKLLRNTISQHLSVNLIKLGLLLNQTKCNNASVKKWLIAFHKECKNSRINILLNGSLMSFKLRLANISSKLLDEMKFIQLNNIYGCNVKYDKSATVNKIRKLIFMKKLIKLIPLHIQRMITDISIYISEAVNQEDINAICINLSNESTNLKRKTFARQVKESLTKYCTDFNNLIDSNDLSKLENNADDFMELSMCLEKFDKTVYNTDSSKSLIDIEFSPIDKNSKSQVTSCTGINNEPEKSTLIDTKIEYIDYIDNFNVIEEWDGCVESSGACTDRTREAFQKDITADLISTMAEINNNILSDITRKKTQCDTHKIIEETKFNSGFIGNEIKSCEYQVISNLQHSFFLDFNKEVDKIFTKVKPKHNPIQNEHSLCQDFLCNRNLITNTKASIKIKNLKNINICETNKKDKEIDPDKTFLRNIPLPNTCFNKINNDIKSDNKTKPQNILGDLKHVTIEDESDYTEELIPQSILDFSEVLNDEFSEREIKESSSKILGSAKVQIRDQFNNDQSIKTSEGLLELQPVELRDGKENFHNNLFFHNYEDLNRVSDTSIKTMISSNDQYRKPQSSFYKTNYSVFNFDEAQKDYDSIQYGHYDKEIKENGSYSNETDSMYNPRDQNPYSYYYNSNYYRTSDHENRCLTRSFVSQSKNSNKRRFN